MSCNAWNTIVEEAKPKSGASQKGAIVRASAALPVSEVPVDHAARIKTGIGELDRVLGGGAVLGSVTLLGGDPGVGKSTLLMQALSGLAESGLRTLYVSGEESAAQTAARARRLGATSPELLVLAENDLDAIMEAITSVRPAAIVIDSVQTVRVPDLESAAGTVSQLREVATRITERAKRDKLAAFLVGHVTKDGSLAGPKVLEHLVDTVLSFEGERGHAFRAVRVSKNRFGSATEVGVFEMDGSGMREVASPSALFLAERPKDEPGSAVCATSEGQRSMLVEVQALVSVSGGGPGRRVSNGVDSGRLSMLLAVLEKKCNLHLSSCDVFVNVAGGVRVEETAADLAVALAVASSFTDRAIPKDIVAFGEIGLAGEVRSVPRAAARLAEARAMGFTRAIVPESHAEGASPTVGGLIGVRTLRDALAAADLDPLSPQPGTR